MAGTRASRQLVTEIARLSDKSVRRIVRLAPKTANAYLRILQRAGYDPQVTVAVERYLLAARRAEKHHDNATKQMFAKADAVLAARLSSMSGADVDLLGRELAQRRLTTLGDPADLQDDFTKVAKSARGVSRDLDLGEALLQRTFLDRLRAVAALGPSQWNEAQRLLMRTRRKYFGVLGGEWADAWEPTFRYLRDNAEKIAASVRALRAAESALAQVRQTGSAIAIRAAEEELLRARRSFNSHLSKIKGRLGEAYVPRWKGWKVQMKGYLEVAEREARTLPGPGRWEVRRVFGDLRLNGSETWDEAILLLNHDTVPPQAKLFLAAQYKVEKQDTALDQIINDLRRETETTASRLPWVTFPGTPHPYALTPMPVGKTTYRHLFNASGGKFYATSIDRLRNAGIQVEQLTLDISVPEFDLLARQLLDVVDEILP